MFLEADNSTGVAYTPSYLVSFMIDECMPINQPKKVLKYLTLLVVSGIFLVSATVQTEFDWWRASNYEKTGKWIVPGKENLEELKKLLKESIYGIDIANEAVDLGL